MINARGGLDQPTYSPTGVNDRHFGYETADRTLVTNFRDEYENRNVLVSVITLDNCSNNKKHETNVCFGFILGK